jgi:Cu2+-exporting ATPase
MTGGECTLCGLPTPDPPVTAADVEGEFCCRGCLEVSRTLDEPVEADAAGARESLETGPAAAEVAGEEAFLEVEGMHCATCESFLEATATEHDGVRAASASYPSGMIKLTYDPDAVDADELPSVVDGLGYRARAVDSEAGETGENYVPRLLVGGFFGMMTMVWYLLFLYPVYVGVDPSNLLLDLSGPAGEYLLANVWLMATIVLGYTGYPIFRGAYVSLRAGHPNMDLLVALAAGTAYLYSTIVTLLGGVEVYHDVAVVIVVVVTLGDYYQNRITRQAAGRLSELTRERVDEARRRTADGGTETVPVEELVPGDRILVRPGERVPVDGEVVAGSAAVDQSLITGESLPVRHDEGDAVVGGAIVTDGALTIAVADDARSTLDRLVGLLWDIQSSRPGAQRLADRIAAVFVPLVVLLAVVATGAHLLIGATLAGALLTGLAVLVVSCPCALGLATPLAIAGGVRTALRRGIVVTDESTFERAPETDIVAFDKTGTLTTGRMALLERIGDDDALARAAAVEQRSEHPIARAVTDAAGPPDAAVSEFETHPGRGVSARVDGDRVVVGRAALLEERDWSIPEALRDRARRARDDGRIPAFVGWDGEARGLLVVGDRPREHWDAVVDTLAADRRIVVLTGDSEAATERFRDHPGIDDVFAGVPPEAKAEVVRKLRADGTTAMVGDGSNDAPALADADVGIAMESGTALAADAADAVITTDDLAAVPAVFDLTVATNRRIRENLGWAFLYNAVAVPLAVVGLITPLLAAIAMATSSLLVVANSSRSLVDDESSTAARREATRPGPAASPDRVEG